jgi:WD40 repeat protein
VEGGVIREEMLRRLTGLRHALCLATLLVGCGGSHDFEFIQMNAVAVSPDGTIIVGGSTKTFGDVDDETNEETTHHEGKIRLYDAASGQEQRNAKLGDGVWGLSYSPDGSLIASADEDRQVRLYDSRTGDYLRSLEDGREGMWSVAFSPDGKTVAAGGRDWKVRLWDLETNTLRRTLVGHGEAVISVAFSPDGTRLASAGWKDETVRIWDATSGALITTLAAGAPAYDVVFSPDGKTLAVASGAVVELWDVQTWTTRTTLNGDGYAVVSVAFSPDGKTLAGCGEDATIRLWDVLSTTRKGLLQDLDDVPVDVVFSPDGAYVAAACLDGRVYVWDAQTRVLRWRSG